MTTTTEETQEEGGTKGRPNAYWAKVREDGTDTMGGAFRGTPPVKRGGPATVSEEDTLGDMEHCWCGLPAGHDWPGKNAGRAHPRKDKNVSTQTAPRLDPRQINHIAKDLQEIVLQAVNTYGLEYKINRNGIRVFPKDGSRPYMFGVSDAGPALKRGRSWFARYVVLPEGEIPPTATYENPLVKDRAVQKEHSERVVNSVVVEALAEALNSEEHKVKKSQPKEEPVSTVETEAPAEPEWVQHVRAKDGTPIEGFVTDGTIVRCTRCDWTTDNRRAVGPHEMTVHQKEETKKRLWENPEAQAKKTDSIRYNTLHSKVTEAIDLLVDLVDYKGDSAKMMELEQQNEALRSEVASVRAEWAKVIEEQKALQERVKELEEAEAKLAIVKEAMGL